MKRSRNLGWWSGVLTAMAVGSLFQDFHGRDQYVEMVRAGWVSGWITVPLAIAMLVIAVLQFQLAARAVGVAAEDRAVAAAIAAGVAMRGRKERGK